MSDVGDAGVNVPPPAALHRSDLPIEGTSGTIDHFRWAAWEASFDPFVVLRAMRDIDGEVVDFEYIDANQAAIDYNRTTRDRLIGSTLLELFPGHRPTTLFASYVRTVDTGEPLILDDFVYPNERLEEERRYDIRSVKVDDALLLSWRDVTERYNEHRRFKMLAENASDIVYEIDLEGVVRWISPSVTRILGWEPEAIVGSLSTDMMWLEDVPAAMAARGIVIMGGAPKSFEIRYSDASGKPRWMRWNGRAVRGHSGAIVAVVVGLTQIDLEVEARTTLSSAQAVYRTLAEHSRDVIIRIDAAGRVDWLSPSVESTLGYRVPELVGTLVKDLFHEESAGNVDAWEAVARSGDRLDDFEVAIKRSDGDFLWMRMTVIPHALDDGHFSGALMTLTDIHREVLHRRAASTLSAGAQALVTAESEASLLRAMCDAALLQGGYEFSWYGRKVMNEAHTVEPVCVSERHREYLDGAVFSWDENERGYGPAGQAIRSGRPVVVSDFQGNENLDPWKNAARRHNFNSVISLPVKVHGEVDGSWQIYASERNGFSDQTVEVLKELALEMGYGLTRLRERDRMMRSMSQLAMLATAIAQSAEEVLITDLEGTITFVNPALCQSSGYSEDELLGSNPRIFQSGLHSREFYEAMWAELTAGRTWQGVLMNRRKNGRVHLEQTVISPIKDEAGGTVGYVGVKHDPVRDVRLDALFDELPRDVGTVSRIEYEWRPGVSLHSTVAKLCSLATSFSNIDAALILERNADGGCHVLGSFGTEMFAHHGQGSISLEESLHTVPSRYSPVMVDMSPAAWPTTSECIDLAWDEGLQSIALFPLNWADSRRGLLLLASKAGDDVSLMTNRLMSLNEYAKLVEELVAVHFQ